jgi:hypothetical protein
MQLLTSSARHGASSTCKMPSTWAVGQAMGGEPLIYDHSPYFYADLFDLGYEAVGELDS